MGLFKRKNRMVREIDDGAWGHLVNVHGMDVDTLTNKMRCVQTEGVIEDRIPVTFIRIFNPFEADQKGILVTGWETFDDHPDLVIFEGYLNKRNEAHLERKRP